MVIYLKNCFVESRHTVDALKKEHAEKALETAYQYGKTGKFPPMEDEWK
jgi:hypothetical protein